MVENYPSKDRKNVHLLGAVNILLLCAHIPTTHNSSHPMFGNWLKKVLQEHMFFINLTVVLFIFLTPNIYYVIHIMIKSSRRNFISTIPFWINLARIFHIKHLTTNHRNSNFIAFHFAVSVGSILKMHIVTRVYFYRFYSPLY